MAFTYDPATDAGKVRLMIADTVTPGHIFEDDEIQAFLDMNDDSIKLAAADALMAIASNSARAAKMIKILDLQVDTRQLAKDLREQAKQLKEDDEESGAFAIAEWVNNPESYRERVIKQIERGEF